MKFILVATFGIVMFGMSKVGLSQDVPTCELQPVSGCESAMAQQVNRAAGAYIDAVRETARFQGDLASSRQSVQRACASSTVLRDHPSKIPELGRLIDLLNDKDMVFLTQQVEVFGIGSQFNDALGRMANGGRRLDGGIREYTTWDKLVGSLNSQMRDRLGTQGGVARNVDAFTRIKQNPEYRRYVLSRNLTELNIIGCNLTVDPKMFVMDALIIRKPWYHPGCYDCEDDTTMTEAYSNAFSYLYGQEALNRAAAAAMSLPKDANGAYSLPGRTSGYAYDALIYELSNVNLHTFALTTLLAPEDNYGPVKPKLAKDIYDELIAAYGQATVDHAAEQLRVAKHDRFGDLVDRSSLDIGRGIRLGAFYDLMAKDNLDGYVRALIAMHQHLTTRKAVDEAYAFLTTRFGADSVHEAAKKALEIMENPSLPPGFPRGGPLRDSLHFHQDQGGSPETDYPIFAQLLEKK